MKFVVLLVSLFVALAATSVNGLPKPDGKYTTKYDNMDLDEILKSDRLMHHYCLCILELGKCTPEGQEIKTNLKDAIQTNCSKCSEKQKKESKRIVKHVKEHKHEDCYVPLKAKYDPNNEYTANYE